MSKPISAKRGNGFESPYLHNFIATKSPEKSGLFRLYKPISAGGTSVSVPCGSPRFPQRCAHKCAHGCAHTGPTQSSRSAA